MATGSHAQKASLLLLNERLKGRLDQDADKQLGLITSEHGQRVDWL